MSEFGNGYERLLNLDQPEQISEVTLGGYVIRVYLDSSYHQDRWQLHSHIAPGHFSVSGAQSDDD